MNTKNVSDFCLNTAIVVTVAFFLVSTYTYLADYDLVVFQLLTIVMCAFNLPLLGGWLLFCPTSRTYGKVYETRQAQFLDSESFPIALEYELNKLIEEHNAGLISDDYFTVQYNRILNTFPTWHLTRQGLQEYRSQN